MSYVDPTTPSPRATALVPHGATAPAVTAADGFDAVIDAINPLHHIPVVSSLYREATGDGISAVARVVGGGIFGGIPGLIASAANALFEAATGSDVGETAIAALTDAGSTDAAASGVHAEGVPLEPDQGAALMRVAAAHGGEAEQAAAAAAKLAAADALKIPGTLASYREDSLALGFSEEGKREQYLGSLDEIALKM